MFHFYMSTCVNCVFKSIIVVLFLQFRYYHNCSMENNVI